MTVPHEYYCKNCGQLRLSFKETTEKCGNCNDKDIVIGEGICSLDKEDLKKRFPKRK